MTFRLLVVDDELDAAVGRGKARRPAYTKLSADFDLLFATSLTDFVSIAAQGEFDAVLMDFVLERWGTDARSLLPTLEGKYPVALISAHWPRGQLESLRATLEKFQEVADFFAWEELNIDSKRHLIVFRVERAIHAAKKLSANPKRPSEAIRVLILSDIQFGGELPVNFKTESQLIAHHAKSYWGQGPDFIAITGDITEHGLPSEFESAKAWLLQVAQSIDPLWRREQFLVIPGNHDVNWALGTSSRIDFVVDEGEKSKDNKKRPRPLIRDEPVWEELRQFAFAPFRSFAASLTGGSQWANDESFWVDAKYRQDGLILFGFDTSEDLEDACFPTRRLNDSIMEPMFKQVRKARDDSDRPLVVGLMHHPLETEDEGEQALNTHVMHLNASMLKESIVLLSGHVHESGWKKSEQEGGAYLLVSGPTPTKGENKRPPDSPRGFSCLTFSRKAGRIDGISLANYQVFRSKVKKAGEVRFTRSNKGELRMSKVV